MAIKLRNGTTPDSLTLLAALANAYADLQVLEMDGLPKDLLITAGRNGKHMPGSRHYTDQALDVRSKTFADREDKLRFLQRVIDRLGDPVPITTSTGPGFQTRDGRWLGILEYEGTANEHFHLERN